MKKIILACALGALVVSVSGCSSSAGGGGLSGGLLTDAGKMSEGIGNSTGAFQSLGSALGGGARGLSRNVHTTSAADQCDTHGAPGFDADSNGSIESGER